MRETYFEMLARRQETLIQETQQYTVIHTFEEYPHQELEIICKWHIGDYWMMQLVMHENVLYSACVLGCDERTLY